MEDKPGTVLRKSNGQGIIQKLKVHFQSMPSRYDKKPHTKIILFKKLCFLCQIFIENAKNYSFNERYFEIPNCHRFIWWNDMMTKLTLHMNK